MLKLVFSQIFTSCRSSSARIGKVDKDFAGALDFKNVKFAIKIGDIQKIKKKINVSIFDYENKQKHPIDVSKKML